MNGVLVAAGPHPNDGLTGIDGLGRRREEVVAHADTHSAFGHGIGYGRGGLAGTAAEEQRDCSQAGWEWYGATNSHGAPDYRHDRSSP